MATLGLLPPGYIYVGNGIHAARDRKADTELFGL